MGLWAKQVLILFKIHWFYVKLKPLIAFMSLFGCVIASLSVMALFKFDVAIDDAKLNIIYMFFFATSPVFILIMGMVAETKRSKLFLSLRRLGIYESAFWFSAASIALVVSWISALMGVAVLTNIPMYDFIKRVDFLVLFLLQGTINMSMAFLALLLSSFFSDHHVTAIESAIVYITSLSTIARNFKYTGLCSFSCEYAENGLFTRIWKNVIWPSYNWSSAWQDIFIVTNPIADVKIPLDDQFFKVEDLFVSVYKRMDETYLRERIEIGFGVIKYDNDLLGAPTVFSLIYSLWIYVPILFFLAWYMHQLVEYQGYTLPWYFPFNKHYWTSVHTKYGVVTKSNTIELEGLTLEYSTKVSKAVDNFTNVMEPGNVYTILGHNGAGKTSLIGMLTGSIQPSSGKGSIFGFDIKSEVSQYLYLTGFCSQEDILVPNMTPFEHIEVFSGVRGIDMAPYGGFEKYCMQLLKKVQLEHVPHKRVDQFSGGMQRRLSFILSTIGDNRVYYLDEPTTGLDPISRHYIWNVIQELKKTSIVVLTSHNMEEAEYLADKSKI
jgi:ABC-type Na+ transport system ATPase subunit NatA